MVLKGAGAASAGAEPARGSLHQRIIADLEERILSGDWPPGHRVPSEHDLTARYGCSRMTVNKALTQLAKAGLILRRRKAGSFVIRPLSQSAVLEIRDVRSEVEALGLDYAYEILDRRNRRSSRADIERLELSHPAPLLEVRCLHRAGRRAFCLEERIVNLEAAPEAADEAFAEVPPGAWLLSRAPWTAAEHTISAVAAEAGVAGLLAIPEGAPCLAVERRTWRADQPVTFVRLIYPGDAHELVARFAPSTGEG